MPIHWITSNGGPYILTNLTTAALWKAAYGISVRNGNGGNDYKSACGVKGYAGVIQGSGGQILVINDLPNDLMMYSNTDSETVLVKWIGADSDEQILSALTVEKNLPFENQNISLVIAEPELVIFDSSCLFDEVGKNKIDLKLVPGSYSVDVLNYEPHDQLMLQLFRFRPIAYPQSDNRNKGPQEEKPRRNRGETGTDHQ